MDADTKLIPSFVVGKRDGYPVCKGSLSPEQRLFLAWGQVWCENIRPERAREALRLPHESG